MRNRHAKTLAGCRDRIRNRDGNLLNTARGIGLGIANTVAATQVKLRQAKTVFLVHGMHKGEGSICRLLETLSLKNLRTYMAVNTPEFQGIHGGENTGGKHRVGFILGTRPILKFIGI